MTLLNTLERYWGDARARLANAISPATIIRVNDSGPLQVVQVEVEKGEFREVPRFAEYGLASSPPQGATQAALLSPNGDRASGAVIATEAPDVRPKNLSSGETRLYSSNGQERKAEQRMEPAGHVVIDCESYTVRCPGGNTLEINGSGATFTISKLHIKRA